MSEKTICATAQSEEKVTCIILASNQGALWDMRKLFINENIAGEQKIF